MRKIYFSLLLLSLCSLFSVKSAYATHIMGVDLTYECLNGCTIRVHLRVYRDCTGNSMINTDSFAFKPQSVGCAVPTPVGNWTTQQVIEVTPICPGIPTKCTNNNATINGVQEYYWRRDYNICNAGNCIFTMKYSACCRNGAITSGAANDTMYVFATRHCMV